MFESLFIGITYAAIFDISRACLLDIAISTTIMTLSVYVAAPVEAFPHNTLTNHVIINLLKTCIAIISL